MLGINHYAETQGLLPWVLKEAQLYEEVLVVCKEVQKVF